MLMNRHSGQFLGYLQAAKRIKYPADSKISVDPFHGGVIKQPVFNVFQFYPTGNPHRILRREYRVASKSRKGQLSIECIDLQNHNAVVWKLDSDSIEKPPGGKSSLFLQFCDGMMRPCRHVVLRSLPGGSDRPHEIWILDTENGKITKNFQLPKDASRAFEPDVSANGRFVALETNSSVQVGPRIVRTRGLYVLDTHSGRPVLQRTLPDLRPLMFLNAVSNDGTVVIKSGAGVALWTPPYKGDPKWVFEFKACD